MVGCGSRIGRAGRDHSWHRRPLFPQQVEFHNWSSTTLAVDYDKSGLVLVLDHILDNFRTLAERSMHTGG